MDEAAGASSVPAGADRSTRGWAAAAQAAAHELCDAPASVGRYYARLSRAFGWRFVAMVSIVYGVNQGIGEEFFGTASAYFFSDPEPNGLGLQPDRSAAIGGFANVPWQVKSVYGIISDTFPIGGLHRTPYIVGAGVLGVFSWAGLWILPVLTAGVAGILLFLGNLSIASPDVMIDASVAEHCKRHPRLAPDLQTLCWASFGIGKIVSAASSGALYDSVWCGSRGLFGLTAFTSIAMLLPAVRGWLSEPGQRRHPRVSSSADDRTEGNASARVASATSGTDVEGVGVRLTAAKAGSETVAAGSLPPDVKGCARLRLAFRDPVAGPLYQLSLLLLVVSMGMGVLANGSDDNRLIFLGSISSAAAVSVAVYRWERGVSMRLARASVFLFLSGALQPSSPLIYYWSRANEENCKPERQRPCFSPEFLSALSVVGYVVFVLGTSLYNKYLAGWSYKRIWTTTQVLLAGIGLLDLALVLRLNLALGIPDKAFVLGDEILSDAVARMNTMPLFVLAASTCPDGVEATLFAMNMGLSNFGGTLGGYNGIGLMWMLGGVSQPEFENLGLFVFIRSLCRLLPILLIPYFVPDGSPRGEAGDAELVPAEELEPMSSMRPVSASLPDTSVPRELDRLIANA